MGKQLGILGFPGLYGGANVELKDQLVLWHKMGLDLYVMPTGNPANEPLLHKTRVMAKILTPGDYSAFKGMPVISFCNDVFLRDIAKIKEYASKTIFVNCMSWLFNAEKEAHKKGLIDLFLYQNLKTQAKVGPDLEKLNKNYKWKHFYSYFDNSHLPFHRDRVTDRFRFGRVSREDADKYAKDTLWIYETMVSPVPKSGIILGFDHRSEAKIGKPPDYIRTYPGNGISLQEFYAHSACIIQKTETNENYPRIGMEAMASGSVLIVDNKGAWQDFIVHGQTGWLCNDSRDFVYYSSKMAYEPILREKIAMNAYIRGRELFGENKARESWVGVLEC